MAIYDKRCFACGHRIGPLDPPARQVDVQGELQWRHAQQPCPEPATPTGAQGMEAIVAAAMGLRVQAPRRIPRVGVGHPHRAAPPATSRSHFEDEEAPIVRRLLSHLGVEAPLLTDPNAGKAADSGADVVWEAGGDRIAYQVTVHHGDEDPAARGGSAIRREESQRARAGQPYTTAATANPLQALVTRILAKVELSAKYDLTAFASVHLVVAAGIPTWGAQGATLLLEPFLDLAALQRFTAPALASSRYSSAYVFVMLSARGRPSVFAWDRAEGWRQVV